MTGRACVNFAECGVVISAEHLERHPTTRACSPRCRGAAHTRRRQERIAERVRAEVAAPGPRSGVNARSGAVVSAGRMVDVLAKRLNLDPAAARGLVADAMGPTTRERWRHA